MDWLTRKRLRSMTTASAVRAPLNPQRVRVLHRTNSGATTSAPPTSPSHQVSQIEPNLAHEAKPVSERLATPTVALTVGLTIPASTANLKPSCAFSNAF